MTCALGGCGCGWTAAGLALLWVAGLAVYGGFLGLLFAGVDRVLVARMQGRIGPPLAQPFADVRKLLHKQDTMPETAVGCVFRFAPVLALAGALTVLLYVPLGGLETAAGPFAGRGDALLGLYLLLLPGLGMVLGGFASGSPYASLGAQREMVSMLSYEFPLATTVLAFAWRLADAGVEAPFSLWTMAEHPIWAETGPIGWVGAALLLGVMLLVLPGELGRIPFDAPEAETELAGGLLVEYSGRNLALFELAQAVKSVALCAWMSALFLPWRPGMAMAGAALPWRVAADLAAFALKSGLWMFLGVSLVRAAVARLRVTDIVRVYWKWLGGAAVAGMLLLMVDAAL
ncbi:MAG: NADH-quinone oxidoreductase subunit H [Kiritimatiellae bacterium]|nr:NADH-quinone oxidoreductase subunit H [Kiritimatiellia bacterium]